MFSKRDSVVLIMATLPTLITTAINLVNENLSVDELEGKIEDKRIVKSDEVLDKTLIRPASEYFSPNW